mgnify:CR=1 FL=1
MYNVVRRAFSRDKAPPEVAEAMAQLRSKLWMQSLQEENEILSDHGEVTLGGKCWRFQTVLADVEPSSSPEYQESIVCGEVTATPILKKEVAAIVLQDASERIAASLRYKQDIQGDIPSLPDSLWLMDTGCGVDLINWAGAGDLKTETVKPQDFQTAGGRIRSEHVVPLYCNQYKEAVRPYLLPETPWVLTVGRRCQEKGCTFIWPAFSDTPVMYTPMGQRQDLVVIDYVPYLRVGESPHTLAAPSIPMSTE